MILNSYRHFLTRDEESPHPPWCRYCLSDDETVEHIFNKCAKLAMERSAMNLNGKEAIRSLYENPKTALALIRKIGLLDDLK